MVPPWSINTFELKYIETLQLLSNSSSCTESIRLLVKLFINTFIQIVL